MPQVPQSELLPDVEPQNEPVARTPRLNIYTNPDMFGANIGRAVQQLGGTMEGVSSELWQRAVDLQKMKNETAAINADADYTMKTNDLFTDFEKNRGSNAVAAGPAFRQNLNEERQKFRDSLPNDDARRQFDARSLNVMTRTMFSGARHEATQQQSAYTDGLQAMLESEKIAAARAPDDATFQKHLDNLDKVSGEINSWAGHTETSGQVFSFEQRSNAWRNRIDYLGKTDAPGAKKMFDDHVNDLTPQDRNTLESKVNSQVLANGSRLAVEKTHQAYMNPQQFFAGRLVSGAKIQSQIGGLDMQFGQNLEDAVTVFEREEGSGRMVKFQSMGRYTAEQAEIRARHEAMPGGVGAHPAALPGTSRHEIGQAVDLADDDYSSKFKAWLHQSNNSGQTNAQKYGLEFLKGRAGINDSHHLQLARDADGNAPHRVVDIRNVPRETYVESAVQTGRNMFGPSMTPQQEDAIKSHAIQNYDYEAQNARLREGQDMDTVLGSLDSQNPPKSINDLIVRNDNVTEAYNRLDAKLQESARKKIERDEPSDFQELARLRGLAAKEPFEFVKPETLGYINTGPFSKRDRRELSQLWAKKVAEPEHDPKVTANFGLIKNLIPHELAYPTPGNKEERDRHLEYLGSFQNMLKAYHDANGVDPKGQDLANIATNLVSDVNQPSISGHKYHYFDLRTMRNMGPQAPHPFYQAQMPVDQMDRLKKDLVEAGTPNPTIEMMNQLFMREEYQRLFGNTKK